MPPFNYRRLQALIAACLTLSVTACDLGFENAGDGGENGGGNGGGEEVTAQEYVAANRWKLSLESDADFELVQRSKPVGGTRESSADGDYEALDSGFSRLTIAASGVTGSAPAANSQLNALALEDDLLLVRNWNTGVPQLMPFIASGTCPSSPLSANWVQLVRPQSASSIDFNSAFFGHLYFSFTNQTMDSERRFALTNDFAEQDPLDTVDTDACDSGVIETNEMTVYFGEDGSALVHQNIGTVEESLWLALPQDPVTSDDLNADYVGYWVDYGRSQNDRVWAGTLNCTSFTCELARVTDISDTTSLANQTFTIELDDQALDSPISGFITGTSRINEGMFTDERPLACLASDNFNDSGDKLLVCVGQSPSSDGTIVNGFFVAAD